MSERHYSRSDTSHMAIHTSQTDLNCWVIFQAILFQKGKAQIISMQLYPHNECTNKSSCKRNTWQGMVLETKRYRWSVPCFHSDRAPSTSIVTFTRSLQEAIENNSSLEATLRSRSYESRAELFSMIREKTAALPVKMSAILSPTLSFALMIILLAPFVTSLMNILQ